MSTTKKIFLDEYEHLYCFRNKVTLATGPEHVDEETPVEKNVFNSLPAFREVSYNKLDEVSCYLYTKIEDVKNEDLLRWWHEHRHVFPTCTKWLSITILFYISSYFYIIFLSLIYGTILTGTFVDMEHVFSQGRLLLPYIHNRLSSESMRALLCLGDWCRCGLMKDSNIKSAALLPDVTGEEPPLASGWIALLPTLCDH